MLQDLHGNVDQGLEIFCLVHDPALHAAIGVDAGGGVEAETEAETGVGLSRINSTGRKSPEDEAIATTLHGRSRPVRFTWLGIMGMRHLPREPRVEAACSNCL